MKHPIIFILTCMLLTACSGSEAVHDARQEAAFPDIYPDYVGVTIPAGIAPLNFCMSDEVVLLVDAVVSDSKGHSVHGQGSETTDFDLEEWHALLAQNVGDSLQVSVSAKFQDGWHSYQPFSLYVSTDSIDYGVAYRMLEPGYEVYSKMGIYERNLSNYEQTTLIENTQFQGCVNCHSFNRANPGDMSLHIRGEHGATLLRHDGKITAYNTATPQTLGLCVYPYWHPSNRYIAYSTNTTRQMFHVADPKRIEVFDQASDLQVYDVEHNQMLLTPLLKRDDVYETFPAFSSDGRTLYFCAARALPEGSYALDSLHYNLCCIDFDPETGRYGDHIDTLINAEAVGKSVTMPRPSYDGRSLMFTMADYGQFSIWHPEADLCVITQEEIDLIRNSGLALSEDLAAHRMPLVNSDDTESFHNWSTNSRWVVFSSRRDDGWFTRLYFTHIDEEGRVTKPFMMPQQNPRRYYRELFLSYNVPDFVSGPVNYDTQRAIDALNSTERKSIAVRE